MNIAKYRVAPGSKVRLSKWDPNDKSASGATKEENLERLQVLGSRINKLQDVLYAERKYSLLVVLQGMDTSGKDGTIRHVFSEVDPLGVRAVAFKAPNEEELAHDFLWRIQRQTPARGELVIFNRSHYEDVLVVRVHNWIDQAECRRRYEQINSFERRLSDSNTIVLKFYLHISKDEQKKRLQERLDDPEKQWKFNPADLAERKLWPEYIKAYANALSATSTEGAPWYVIPANSKTNRNLLIGRILYETLKSLKMRYPKPTASLDGVVID
ncbi:MAG: polyphosphate kinase 2 family protein [Betaproteobacteria bacterium]